MMKTIEIQIPDQFEIDNNELNTFVAVKLFEVAKFTCTLQAVGSTCFATKSCIFF